MRLTFKSVDFEQNRLPSVMGVGLFQCRKRNGLRSYEKEGILPPDSGYYSSSSLGLQPAAYPAYFRPANPHSCVVSVCGCLYPIVSVSLENPD